MSLRCGMSPRVIPAERRQAPPPAIRLAAGAGFWSLAPAPELELAAGGSDGDCCARKAAGAIAARAANVQAITRKRNLTVSLRESLRTNPSVTLEKPRARRKVVPAPDRRKIIGAEARECVIPGKSNCRKPAASPKPAQAANSLCSG